MDRNFFAAPEHLQVLFVDDDPILREFACVHLASETFQIITAADGVSALDILATHPVDILLLDLEMPKMNGFEVLQMIRVSPTLGNIPVIVVTGREDIAAIDRAYEAGATSFMIKPINWRQFLYQIRYVFRAHQTERALIAACADARAEARRSHEALASLARESAQFVKFALASEPSLRSQATRLFDQLHPERAALAVR